MYNKNVIGVFFFVSCLFTIIVGYMGIISWIKDNNIFSSILGLLFLVITGYVYLRAYTAVIEDSDNKKQP